MKRTHLDFTTLFGAALSFEKKELNKKGLLLSRLLNLSQFIESLIVFDKLQYEVGESEEWAPYINDLKKTEFYNEIHKLKYPIKKYKTDFDHDEKIITQSVTWAINNIEKVSTINLKNAIKYRTKTYSAIENVDDYNNPFYDHYINTALANSDVVLCEKYDIVKNYLKINSITQLGLHVLIRIKLLYDCFVEKQTANYYPHFSRNPLLIDTNLSNIEIEKQNLILWTSQRLKNARKSLYEQIWKTEDEFTNYFSPFFIACLYNAKKPLDILTNALELRRKGKHFRGKINYLLKSQNPTIDDVDFSLMFIQELDLLERSIATNIDLKHVSKINFESNIPGPIFKVSISKSREDNRIQKHKSILFIHNILRQALAVISLNKKIEDVFGCNLVVDCDLIG